MEQFYTSGNWHVRSGSEEEFIKRWTGFVEAAKDKAHGRFFLVRQNDDSSHFVSMGIWNSREDQDAWMSMPDFREAFAACSELCDESHGGAYSLVTSVG